MLEFFILRKAGTNIVYLLSSVESYVRKLLNACVSEYFWTLRRGRARGGGVGIAVVEQWLETKQISKHSKQVQA